MESEDRYKALKIPASVYEALREAKRLEIERAKRQNDNDKLGMLAAMGLGAFAGYLIYKVLRDLQQNP